MCRQALFWLDFEEVILLLLSVMSFSLPFAARPFRRPNGPTLEDADLTNQKRLRKGGVLRQSDKAT